MPDASNEVVPVALRRTTWRRDKVSCGSPWAKGVTSRSNVILASFKRARSLSRGTTHQGLTAAKRRHASARLSVVPVCPWDNRVRTHVILKTPRFLPGAEPLGVGWAIAAVLERCNVISEYWAELW